MQKKQESKNALKNLFHWINRAVGTFLFVFFMMAAFITFTTDIRGAFWIMPYFILPAYIICATAGAKYWGEEDQIQRWSYCISTIVSALVLLPETAFSFPFDVQMPLFRMIVTVLLSILVILYGILKVRTKKTINQQIDEDKEETEAQSNWTKRKKAIRIICLLSICCVLFENGQSAIMIAYGFITNVNLSIEFSTFSPFPLSILSAILLARFIKAECVPINNLPD